MLWIGLQGGVAHPALGRTAAAAVAQRQQAAEEGDMDASGTPNPKHGLQAAAHSQEGDWPTAANDGHSSAAWQHQQPSAASRKAPGAGRRRQPRQ